MTLRGHQDVVKQGPGRKEALREGYTDPEKIACRLSL